MAEEEKGAAEASKSGSNPLLSILLIANALIMGAVAYFQYESHVREAKRPSFRDIMKAEMKEIKKEEEAEESEQIGSAKDEDGTLFPLDGFTANLAQGDGPRRFLRLQAVLKFSKDSNEEEFKARKPQIRDSIISILNSKRPEDLLRPAGKNYLKEEIKAAINSFLVDGNIIDIYYVGFQIN